MSLQSLAIENFRAIRSLTLDELPDVCLLVGKNNCGKTTVLEAAYLLASQGDANDLNYVFHLRNAGFLSKNPNYEFSESLLISDRKRFANINIRYPLDNEIIAVKLNRRLEDAEAFIIEY